MKRPAIMLPALMAAACQGQNDGRPPPAAVAMRPGVWETSFRVLSVEAPTAPSEIGERLRAGISTAPVTERSCLSQAEAADPATAVGDRAVRTQTGYTCDSGERVFSGGRIRMTLTCRSATGQPNLQQAMVGSFTAETLQAAITGESATPATDMLPAYPVRIESTLTGRRIGDCPAGAAN